MEHCYSYDIKLYPLDGTSEEETMQFESYEDAINAAEEQRLFIGEKWEGVELVRIDWFMRCDSTLEYWDS